MPDDNLSRWIRQGRLGSCQCQISLAVGIGHPGSLRSAVKLLVLRYLLVGTHIERRALVGKQPAAEGKIVAERVAHEIHGVKVPVLKIHRMHLVALRPVYGCVRSWPRSTPSCTCRRAATSSRASRRGTLIAGASPPRAASRRSRRGRWDRGRYPPRYRDRKSV